MYENIPKNLPIQIIQKLSFHSVTPSEICKCLRKLRRKTAHGIDELAPNLLKDVANEISKPLTFIINKSLSSGIVPDLRKILKVRPLYKSDSKSDFSNYRPISVLPCLSKVLEQVVHRQLSNYLEKHYLLKSSQFGFRPLRSMELGCNLLVDDIRKNIDNDFLTGAIYLDLSKAFDTVSHSYLLSKLPSYGINRNECSWFENYLFNRKQHVFYDGHLSKAFPVFRDVPQGSILGPTLFFLHLDDIDNCLHHSSIIKYADDTVIYVSGNDSELIQKKLNADNLEVHNWLTDNDLSLNLKKVKTKTMIFGTSIRVKKAAPLNIQIKGTSINQTPWYKYLRNHLDSTLQMNGNFNSKYKKLSSRSRLLSKLRPDLNVKASK